MLAVITEREPVSRILVHLGLPTLLRSPVPATRPTTKVTRAPEFGAIFTRSSQYSLPTQPARPKLLGPAPPSTAAHGPDPRAWSRFIVLVGRARRSEVAHGDASRLYLPTGIQACVRDASLLARGWARHRYWKYRHWAVAVRDGASDLDGPATTSAVRGGDRAGKGAAVVSHWDASAQCLAAVRNAVHACKSSGASVAASAIVTTIPTMVASRGTSQRQQHHERPQPKPECEAAHHVGPNARHMPRTHPRTPACRPS